MIEEQGALETRRNRRPIPVILLGLAPAALATILFVGTPGSAAPAPGAGATEVITREATLSAGAATAVRENALRTAISYRTFCANPSNPVSTSGTTGKALLSTVNRERAKLGLRQLTWSSTMASTAVSWSRTMLSRDLRTTKLIDGLAHNPNRPGAENVAVIYRSTGYVASSAITKLHGNLVRSEGHCRNLMNPNFKTMGSGIARSSSSRTWYATENFR